MAGLIHLAKRFFGAARPGAPSEADEQWAIAALSEAEAQIWRQMSNPDRRHGIQVARDVANEITETSGVSELDFEPWILPAALLHDSGKIVSGFRTPARVLATILWAVAGDDAVEQWLTSSWSLRRRMAEYRNHPELGAELLRTVGAHNHAVSWAEEHHSLASAWTVPADIAVVLKRCDDD